MDKTIFASVSYNLPANSTASSAPPDTIISYNHIDTSVDKVFKLNSNGELKFRKNGFVNLIFNNNYYNSTANTSTFGIYATLNGQVIPTSQIFRGVSAGQTAPLLNSAAFTVCKGDKLAILMTQPSATPPIFKTPASPSLQGFPPTSPIGTQIWTPHYYSVQYMS